MKWTTLRQERDQAVLDFTHIFHTLCTKLGIKYSERHLVLKYYGALHRYIQTEWNLWTSRPWAYLIDMSSKSSKSSNKRRDNLGLETPHRKTRKGWPQPIEKRTKKTWTVSKQLVQDTSIEGHQKDK
jgi:hypothetical protein